MSADLTIKIREDLDGRMFGKQAQHGIAAPACSGSLCTSLVASWKLDDLVDATGTVTNLTNNNSVSFVSGKIGNAGQFNSASSRFLSHASVSALEMGDIDFTIGAWVYLDSKSADMRIVAKHDDSSGHDYALFYNAAFDTFSFTVSVGAALQTVNTSDFLTINTGTWYCVIAWHDTSVNKIFISKDDGTAFETATGGSLDSPLTSVPFRIGARAYTSFENYWDGKIDNVNIWKKALSSGERTAWYNSGTGLEYPYSVT